MNGIRIRRSARLLVYMIATGIVLLVSGCSSEPTPSGPLRVGVLIWPPYEMAYLAKELGYYDRGNIELVGFRAPGETLRAYNSGAVDCVALTTNYVLQLAARDPSQRIVQIINVSNGADVLLARPAIESLEQLRGKRIGIERSALGAYILQRILDKSELVKGDIEIVSVEISEGPSYYGDGRVDALVTYEPFRTEILRQGAHELFSSRELPNEIMDVLIARESIIESRAEDVGVLVKGWIKAIETYQGSPEAYAAELAKREGLTPEEFIATFEDITLTGATFNQEMLVERPALMVTKLEEEADVLRRADFLTAEFDFPSLLHGHFVEVRGE